MLSVKTTFAYANIYFMHGFGSTVCAGRDIIHGMGAEIVFEEVCNGGEVDEVG